MKPVNLEILLNDKTGASFKSLSKNMDLSKDDFNVLIGHVKVYIQTLEEALKKAEKSFAGASAKQDIKKYGEAINEAKSELMEASFALQVLEKGMENTESSSVSLRTQMQQLRNKMADMTEGTEEYAAAMAELGRMQDRYDDISAQGRIHGDDHKHFRAAADAVSALSGAMSAGVGIASLFGAKEEELARIQTKLQAVMATTIGLQQVAQTLNKDSYFSHIILAGAKKKWAAAQAVLNKQLGISIGLSKALMAGGIGLLIAGVATLVSLYKNWNKEQKELRKFRTEAAKSAQQEISNAENLQRVLRNSNYAYDVRKKALDKLKEIMPEYNAQLGIEGQLIEDNTGALKKYVQQLKNAALAKSAMERVVQAENKYTEWIDSLDKKAKATLVYGDTGYEFENPAQRMLYEKLSSIRDNLTSEVNKWQSRLEKYTADSILGDNKNKGSGTGSKTKPDNKILEYRLAAIRKIKEQEIALMREGEEKRKAQAKLEFDNKIEEIKREKAEREKHIRELTKAGIPVSKQEIDEINTQAIKQAVNAEKIYNEQIRQIEEETARNNAAIQKEIKLNFASRLEQQLADIDDYYGKLREKAKGNATLIARIELAQIKERQHAIHDAQLREIEFETKLANRRQELDNKRMLFATDKREKLLQIELSGARKRLAKLEEMRRDGMDTAKEIKEARLEIEKLSAELKNIPTERVREIGKHLKSMLSSLSFIGGEIGETFSELASGVDDVLATLDENVSKSDLISTAIGGLAKIYGMAGRQLEENRRKQEEWNDKIEEAVHKARMLRIEGLAYKEGNIFGVENPYAKAIVGAQQYGAAMKELNGSLNKLMLGHVQVGSKKVISGKNIATGASGGAAAGAAIGSIIPGVGTAIGAAVGGFLGGLFGATRKKLMPVFNSLTKEFGSILKEGSKTFELNPKILENYNRLDESTKKLVDNWEEIRGKALEAQEQMRQTFKELAGDIGNSLSSALAESFRNNDLYSAVDKFHDKVSGTIEKIVEQLIFSAHFQKMFDQLQDRFEKSVEDGGDGSIVDDIIWFTKNYKDKIAAYGKDMEAAREQLKMEGFDLFQSTTGRTAVAKGIAQASQDSVDENNARLTNIQGRLMEIAVDVKDMASGFLKIFNPINRIADNTDRLEAIEKGIIEVNEKFEKINREGLYLKK